MDKLLEKKNLGIPVTMLTVLAYLIGYAVTTSYSMLLVAVLFGVLVFALQFDDKVRTAVKHSYMVSFLSCIVYIFFDLLYQFVNMVTPSGYESIGFQLVINNIYRYGLDLAHMAVIIIFLILLILALTNKDAKINVVDNILGEGKPKPVPMYQPIPPHMYQQPGQPIPQPMYQQTIYQQPGQPMPHPMYQQPVQPPIPQPTVQSVKQPEDKTGNGHTCPKCGMMNRPEAVFCAACGTKIQ